MHSIESNINNIINDITNINNISNKFIMKLFIKALKQTILIRNTLKTSSLVKSVLKTPGQCCDNGTCLNGTLSHCQTVAQFSVTFGNCYTARNRLIHVNNKYRTYGRAVPRFKPTLSNMRLRINPVGCSTTQLVLPSVLRYSI